MSDRDISKFSNDLDQIYIPDYDGSNNPIYICKARPGALTSEPLWQIRKCTWTGTNLNTLKWAEGSNAYIFIADDRGSYTFT